MQQAPVQQPPHAGQAGPGSAVPVQEVATETVAQPAPPPAS
jgi:hypothetical protein